MTLYVLESTWLLQIGKHHSALSGIIICEPDVSRIRAIDDTTKRGS